MTLSDRPWHRSYDAGVPADLRIDAVPLPTYLRRAAEQHPERTAIAFQNTRIAYREFQEDVDRLATALAARGVGRGDRVAIFMPNLPQTAISVFAVLTLGAHCVMTNSLYVEREIEHQWTDAGCRVAIVADFLFDTRIKPHRERLPVHTYIVASIPEYLRFPLNVFANFKLRRMTPPSVATVAPGEGIAFFRELIRSTPIDLPEVELATDDVALVQYTGGTTGLAKGALLTHRSISANLAQLAAWYDVIKPAEEVVLSALPFFHVFGLVGTLFLPVSIAATMVVVPNPRDTRGLARTLARNPITLLPAVPALFSSICNHAGIEEIDLSAVKLCISGAAPLPSDVTRRFFDLTGCRIVEGFGMTEVSLSSHANPYHGTQKAGSIGLPLPATDIRIVDIETGENDVPAGAEGELIIRGPQLMDGYLNRPAETADTLRGEWLYTGDLARMDEDGYFFIVGRKKDMIKTNGFMVFPDEIDEVLLRHPSIREACSIGVADERRGEVIKSFVVLRHGTTLDETALLEFCREHLAAYKLPRSFEVLDELPKSGVLKVLRRVLRDREAQRMSPANPV